MPEKNITKIGVGAVVFKDDAILLVKRKNPPNKDQWAIPGGKVHFCEPLKEAVARETLEETGIVITVQEPIFTFEIIQAGNDKINQNATHYVVIDYSASYCSGHIKAGDDAKSAAWVKRGDMKKLDVNQLTRTLLRDKFSFP